MKSEIKTALILGLVIAVGVRIIRALFSSLDDELKSENTSENSISKINKLGLKMAPDLVGIAHYFNTIPEELNEKVKDNVVLYDIWTYRCINCVRILPFITAWDEKYSDQGLLIIGIHSPEFEFEKDVENVRLAVSKHGIQYPVVLDNDMDTWKAFENRYWSRKYIADHEG
ncbi:MAG: hypothetical protein ACRBB5_05835 [Nitrosopumilus sp.]